MKAILPFGDPGSRWYIVCKVPSTSRIVNEQVVRTSLEPSPSHTTTTMTMLLTRVGQVIVVA